MKNKRRNGIGILVNNGGYTIENRDKRKENMGISEGYWKKGRLHGPGRIIGDAQLIFELE